MPQAPDRDKALELALAQIDKQFGKGSVMRLGDEGRAPVSVIPTGSIALDVALGVGGLPRGRVVEIYGPESSGKTTVTLHAVANAQAQGGVAAFIDAEHALDPEYAKALGVDTDALLVSQPDTGEQALEIMDMLIRSNALDVIVVDSVAALVPRAEIEGDMGDSHVGLQARLMSQALRKITGALNHSGTTAIFINQLREKVGVMFGSPETTTGGKALKFYASVRLDIRRIETLKDGTDAVGNRTRVKVVKNKVAPPFKQAEFDMLYGVGISREGSLIDVGVEQGFVRKSGAWYTYDGDQLGQGKENARKFLKENPDVAAEIEKRIKEKLGVGPKLDADETTPAPRRLLTPVAQLGGGGLRPASAPAGARAPGRRRPHRGRAAPGTPEADPPADPESAARTVCLNLLTTRARTRAELAGELERRGFDDEVADDGARPPGRGEAARRRRVRRAVGRLPASPPGPRLAGRCPRSCAGKASTPRPPARPLAGLDADAEREKAGELVRRRLPSLDRVEPQAAARRLVGMLARKGYGAGLAYEVVRTEMAAARRRARRRRAGPRGRGAAHRATPVTCEDAVRFPRGDAGSRRRSSVTRTTGPDGPS